MPIATVRNTAPLPLVAHPGAGDRCLPPRDSGRCRGWSQAAVSRRDACRTATATRLLAALADDRGGEIGLFAADVTGSYPALTPECPSAHYFEREIFEQFEIEPTGHPWLKPVRFPLGGPPIGQVDFFRVSGEEIHEVAVGPVHAGVIEPGHFRFNCHGERVLHLETALGYQHRGVEAALRRWAAQDKHPPGRNRRRRYLDRPRDRLLPGVGRPGRRHLLAARPDLARDSIGAGTNRQPYRRSRGAGRRCRVSAGRRLLRPAARRRAESDRASCAAVGSAAAGCARAASRMICDPSVSPNCGRGSLRPSATCAMPWG